MNQASGNKFEIGTVIGQAWEGFKSNAGILIGITAIQMVILYGFNFIIAMVVMVPFEKQQEKLMADLNTITGQSWEIDGPIFDVGENQSDAKQPEAKLPKPDAKKETKTESKTEPASLNSMIWEQAVLGGISGFFLGFINVFFQLGWIVISLKIIRGESPKIGDLFSQWRRYGTGLLASLMVSVLFMIGLVLLIIPGIIVGLDLLADLVVHRRPGHGGGSGDQGLVCGDPGILVPDLFVRVGLHGYGNRHHVHLWPGSAGLAALVEPGVRAYLPGLERRPGWTRQRGRKTWR